MKNINEFVNFIESKWFDKTGLIAALLLTLISELSFVLASDIYWLIGLVLIIFSLSLIFGIWVWTRLPPKTPNDKVGFLVSITTSDDQESLRLKEDFLVPLRQLIKSGRTGNSFHYMELPSYISKDVIDHDYAQEIRSKSKAHFFLFGRVRLRVIDGIERHVIDMDGIVAHNPIPKKLAKK